MGGTLLLSAGQPVGGDGLFQRVAILAPVAEAELPERLQEMGSSAALFILAGRTSLVVLMQDASVSGQSRLRESDLPEILHCPHLGS